MSVALLWDGVLSMDVGDRRRRLEQGLSTGATRTQPTENYDTTRALVDAAVSRRLRIRFTYVDRTGRVTEREVLPLEFCKWGNCIRGFCTLREDERVFTVSRMRDVRLSEVDSTSGAAVPLFQHQVEILQLLSERDRLLVLAEMGTGKTLPVLLHLSSLLASGAIKDALVVAPLSAIPAWHRDIELLTPERRWFVESAVSFVNYDRLSRSTGADQQKYWGNWGCLVLDEGHAIANPDSNRTQYFVGRGASLGLASLAGRVYVLTGTLVANRRLRDIWAPLRCLLGDDWMTYRDFRLRYLKGSADTDGNEFASASAQELLALVGQHSYRIRKADCLDLPEMMPDTVIGVPFSARLNPAPFSATTGALYAEVASSYRELVHTTSPNPLARFMQMRQIAAGCVPSALESGESDGADHQSHALASDKPRYALELIEANLPNKTVVFHEFVATGLAMEHALTEAGISYVTLNGAQKDKSIWRRFQADPSISVIVAQYASGSVGIDLHSASTTIYLEPTASSTVLSQSRGRTHRSGQHSACNYYFLLTPGTLEEQMYDRIRSGEDFTEQAYRTMVLSLDTQQQKHGE